MIVFTKSHTTRRGDILVLKVLQMTHSSWYVVSVSKYWPNTIYHKKRLQLLYFDQNEVSLPEIISQAYLVFSNEIQKCEASLQT